MRAERYAVDTAALRPYFELDRVLVDGVFHAAELLYGYRFTPRPDLHGYHPDVRVWEVSDADGAAGRASTSATTSPARASAAAPG